MRRSDIERQIFNFIIRQVLSARDQRGGPTKFYITKSQCYLFRFLLVGMTVCHVYKKYRSVNMCGGSSNLQTEDLRYAVTTEKIHIETHVEYSVFDKKIDGPTGNSPSFFLCS